MLFDKTKRYCYNNNSKVFYKDGIMQIGTKEIAREGGVSTAAVSLVLNGSKLIGEETKRRVLEIAKKEQLFFMP